MGRLLTYGSAVFLAIGGFLFGYDSGIINSTIALDTFDAYFGRPDATVTGGVVSCFQGGAVLGTIINMLVADRLGRKHTVAAGAVLSVAGCVVQTAAVTMAMLMVGRFVAGAAVGMLTATIAMYASELAEARHRGILSGLLQWMLSWGYLFAQWIGYGCSYSTSSFSWRFPLGVQTIPALMLLGGVWFLVESPRWLVEKDRLDEARAVLARLRSGVDPALVELEFREIRDVVVADRALGRVSWKSILVKPSWRRRLALGCGIQALGPLSGINVINYYGSTIYQLLGIETKTSLMITGISGAFSIIYCTVGLWLLERVGRVKPLIVSAGGMACALLVNATLAQYRGADGGNDDQLRAMVAMYFVFSLFYTPLGIISWVYPAEIFPVEVRALGNAVTTFTNWSVNLVFAQFTDLALERVGFRFFYLFFAFNLVAMVSYILFYPETKGKTLEQMDELFGDQLVPHALQDPEGARAAMEKDEVLAKHLSHTET